MMAELNERIATLEGQAREIKEELHPLYQQRAEANCPFKVGDLLVDEKGRRTRVSRITPGWAGLDGRFPGMRGRFLRKDGSEGREGELYSWYGWKVSP